MAFLDTRDRALIGGDTFTTYWQPNVTNRLRQPFPLAAMGTQDRSQVVESARKLRALEPSVLLVGHGPALRDPGSTMEQAIARASR
jgi:glyoxylase-like metal-dependent hydrolase (beta-lactamase superfamily II)